MNRMFRAVAAAAVAAIFSGCIESTTTILVAPDGAGTVTEVVHVNRAAERMLGVLANIGRALEHADETVARAAAQPPPPRAYYEKRAAAMGEGVSLLELKPVRRSDGVTGLSAVYSFADVRTLKVPVEVLCPGLFPVYGSPGEIASLTTRHTVRFELADGSPRRLLVRTPWAAGAQQAAERRRPAPGRATTSSDDMALWRHVLNGFNARMFVQTASPMLRTDATYTETNPNQPAEKLVKLFEMNLGDTVRADPSLDRLIAIGPVATMNEALEQYGIVPGVSVEARETVTIEF